MKKLIIIVVFSISCSRSHDDSVLLESAGVPVVTVNAEPEFHFASHYFKTLDSIRNFRTALHQGFTANINPDSVLQVAATSFHFLISHTLYEYWKGTIWDFYGITDTPGMGYIACGYFVTTLLRDVGVKLNRVVLAKSYSERMIKSLLQSSQIKKYVPSNLKRIMNELIAGGNNLYLIGLDNHTGFISVEDDEVWFIHSSALSPGCVVKEKAASCAFLSFNYYTVLGCLTGDKTFLKRWLGVN